MQRLAFTFGFALVATIGLEVSSFAQDSELERRRAEIEMMQEEFDELLPGQVQFVLANYQA